jgi:exopolysaccharide biosynthesis polyprenyl glycosylphosphotransferase
MTHNALLESEQNARFKPTFVASHFRRAAERLQIAQLRDGSLYSNLRALIPVPILAVVWFCVVPGSANVDQLLGRTVTIRHLLLACGVGILWNLWLGLSLYKKRTARKDIVAEITRLIWASVVCGGLPLIANLTRERYSLGFYIALLMASCLLTAALLLLGGFYIAAALSHRLLRQRVTLIVGTGKRAAALKDRLTNNYAQFRVFGCVDTVYCGKDSVSDNYLGSTDILPELLKAQPIEVVLIGLPMKSQYDEIQRVIEICDSVGVESHYMHDLFEIPKDQPHLPSRQSRHFPALMTLAYDPKQYLKRVFDIVAAVILLILSSPLMLLAVIAIRISSPGPILFIQQRYGLNRKRFPMFKFRSMVVDAEQRQAGLESVNEAQGPVFKLKSDPRVTRVGAFLRRTSIDELPQLFNILRGEMSIVGPRPLPLRDVSRFEESWLLRRFSVRPGLTCLWQVKGRSNTSFDFWIKQDLAYIDEWSLMLDFKILFLTIPAVLKGSGAV